MVDIGSEFFIPYLIIISIFINKLRGKQITADKQKRTVKFSCFIKLIQLAIAEEIRVRKIPALSGTEAE